jgi:hypothetical protein
VSCQRHELIGQPNLRCPQCVEDTIEKKIRIHVTSAEQAPKQKHWAIAEFGKRRDAYDEGDEACIYSYTAFLNEEEWRKEVEEYAASEYRKNFLAFVVTPCEITKKVVITVK